MKEQLWSVREGGARGTGHFRKWSPCELSDEGKERTGVILTVLDGDLLLGTAL